MRMAASISLKHRNSNTRFIERDCQAGCVCLCCDTTKMTGIKMGTESVRLG